jgi:allantoate deiminase
VEEALAALARIGAHGETGVWRPVYGEAWAAAQETIAGWMAAAGLEVRRDAVGNVWGRLAGSTAGPAIATGSHIDSQLPGGRFDGALGVVGGLIALRTLRQRFGQPRRTLEVVSFCEEEASRFPTANFWGSRAVIGRIGAEEAAAIRDLAGRGMVEAMAAVGLDAARIGEARRGADELAAFVELHIEQGPRLEAAAEPVAVVTAITGYRQYWIELGGRAAHAGAFPMAGRRDPMAGAAEIVTGVIGNALTLGPPAVTTVGRMTVEPNARAIVPAQVAFTVDARHSEVAARRALLAAHEATFEEVAARHGLDLAVRIDSDRNPCPCAPELVAALADAAAAVVGRPVPQLASGAVHDAQQMAALAPVAMLFVRSRDGLSHTPDEFSSLDDCVAGVETLATALWRLAY